MYAVLKTGGKQYRVSEGDVITVEKLAGDVGSTIEFADVLMTTDGESYKVGTPNVADAKVTCEIVAQTKDKKIIVFKSKRRKSYAKKQGHRQCITQLKVTGITA